jgi:hypothetical protein
MKKCKKCIEKPLAEFSKSKANKDGLQNLCKECSRKASHDYASKNKDLESQRKAEWYLRNKERVLNKSKRWNFANRSKINANKYRRYHTDVNFKLADILRSRITKFLRHGKVLTALGCSVEELKRHLESRFQPGMTWENWSKTGWHVDHVKALSKFNLMDPVEFAKASHYTNLQPLWAEDNHRKHNK